MVLLQATLVKLTSSQKQTNKKTRSRRGTGWEEVGVSGSGDGTEEVNMIKIHYAQV